MLYDLIGITKTRILGKRRRFLCYLQFKFMYFTGCFGMQPTYCNQRFLDLSGVKNVDGDLLSGDIIFILSLQNKNKNIFLSRIAIAYFN